MIFSLSFVLVLVAELISNAATYWILSELLPSILSGGGTEWLGLTVLPALYFSFPAKHTLNPHFCF